jgi:hypothetical protein
VFVDPLRRDELRHPVGGDIDDPLSTMDDHMMVSTQQETIRQAGRAAVQPALRVMCVAVFARAVTGGEGTSAVPASRQRLPGLARHPVQRLGQLHHPVAGVRRQPQPIPQPTRGRRGALLARPDREPRTRRPRPTCPPRPATPARGTRRCERPTPHRTTPTPLHPCENTSTCVLIHRSRWMIDSRVGVPPRHWRPGGQAPSVISCSLPPGPY